MHTAYSGSEEDGTKTSSPPRIDPLRSVLEEHEEGDGGCYTRQDEGEDHRDDLDVRSGVR